MKNFVLPDMSKPVETYRAFKSIDCQDGTLGLHLDIKDYDFMWTVTTGIYYPGTSFGYLKSLRDADISLKKQVEQLSSELLEQFIAHVAWHGSITTDINAMKYIGKNKVMFFGVLKLSELCIREFT